MPYKLQNHTKFERYLEHVVRYDTATLSYSLSETSDLVLSGSAAN